VTTLVQAFYLARQPIYDSRLRVAGYELLFRGGPADAAHFSDGDQATSEVITSSVVDIGLDNLVGSHPAFINATSGFLNGDLPLPEQKGRIVLEVLEHIELDDALLKHLTALSQAGYQLALDDFVYRPGCEPMLRLVDYVKLDVQALGADELAWHVDRLRPYGARLIAEKVEDYPMLATCRELGFDMYQGFFFCRPRLIRGTRPEANRLAVMQLIARLQNPATGMDDLERLVACDPALSYRLLKYINSAYCALRVSVTSIRQALIMVGTNLVRSWATLLLMSRLSDGKPSELIGTALIRARMCELLGKNDSSRDDSQYFTVGLLSVLDALLDVPMEQVVAGLPFDDEICAALSDHAGTLGSTLARVIDYERGVPAEDDLDAGIAKDYVQALSWALETQQAISA
jgi:EAL and modified HD-GYP domain-containing signal transduction protein